MPKKPRRARKKAVKDLEPKADVKGGWSWGVQPVSGDSSRQTSELPTDRYALDYAKIK